MFLLALLSILPHDSAARDTFDVCEVQQMFSWCGREQENGDVDYYLKPVFTQLLFRRWNGDDHIIEAWRMAKPSMVYGYSHAKQVHEIRWIDGDIERVVRCRSMRYTAADFDSEIIERETWPKEWRQDLLRRKKGRE